MLFSFPMIVCLNRIPIGRSVQTEARSTGLPGTALATGS
jgi:hypothetical protein